MGEVKELWMVSWGGSRDSIPQNKIHLNLGKKPVTEIAKKPYNSYNWYGLYITA